MFCPNCGIKTDESICPSCQTDILQYTLVDKMSFEAYNKGLSLAKDGDISGAIVELEKSIKYNGTNITALNLLGLCYDRVGRIGDASKYWIRSCLVEDDNVATEYVKAVEEKASKREKLNESVKMYNQGLIYARQKSYDIAIIQLKNCIDRNEDFVEALNLLATVYVLDGEPERAVPLLKRVLKIDVKNKKALQYLESLNYKYSPSKKVPKKEKDTKKADPQVQKMYKQRNPKVVNRDTMFAFGMGLTVMLLVYLLLLLPNLQSGFNTNRLASEKGYKDQIQQQSTTISANETELNSLRLENTNLKDENAKLKKDYDALAVYVNLDKADKSIQDKDYKTAASQIADIDPTAVAASEVDKYNELKLASYPLASKSYYDSGVAKYGQQKFQEGIDDFELSIKYGGTDKSYYPNTLFYLGRCYEGLGNNEQAKTYYDKIVNEYPNNDTVYSAKSRLNTISN